MSYPTPTNQIEIYSHDLTNLLSLLSQSNKPLILTSQGKGIAAIVPYADPDFIKGNSKSKLHGHKIR